MYLQCLLKIFLFTATFGGVNPQLLRIVGGYPTTIDQYPILAQMLRLQSLRPEQYVQHCAAVIVTSRHLISTAHCFQHDASLQRDFTLPKYWRVRLGSSFRTGGGTLYNLKRIIPHERFNRTFYFNDIALVVVEKPITSSKNVQQSTIIEKGYKIKPYTGCIVAGWGASQFNGGLPDQLHYTFVFTVERKSCEERYDSKQAIITEGMMCAGSVDNGGLDACVGDSGGPLIYNGVVVGLVSFGVSCGHNYYPGVYTNLAYYTDWINQTTIKNKYLNQ